MKTQIPSIALVILLSCPVVGFAQKDLSKDPAYLPIDKVLDPEIARPEVNINLPRFLLKDAASEFDGSTNDPLAAAGINFSELIKDIKLIRVMVIEAKDDNKPHIEKAVTTLRKKLETDWTTIVSVPEDGVGIYALSDEAGENMAGLAMLIHDDEDVVVGNIVGRVSIGKIIKMGTRMNAIPPEVLEKLSGMSENGGGNPEATEPAEAGKSKRAAD